MINSESKNKKLITRNRHIKIFIGQIECWNSYKQQLSWFVSKKNLTPLCISILMTFRSFETIQKTQRYKKFCVKIFICLITLFLTRIFFLIFPLVFFILHVFNFCFTIICKCRHAAIMGNGCAHRNKIKYVR